MLSMQRRVLGMNRRNADYILKYNPRYLYPRADSKILAKSLALEAGLPVPELYDTFQTVALLRQLKKRLRDHPSFVIKPEHGSGGEGILVLDQHGDGFQNSAGRILSESEVRYHIANILYGLYSLGGQSDRAMVEYRVKFDPVFSSISYRGVPDIRIIVFLGVPVMAMLRLPTKASNGRANLHQGALGVGVNMSSGITKHGVLGSHLLDVHPDTENPVVDTTIPHWQEMLQIACRSYEVFELGYFGIDIVLDKDRGPLILELNARPGLAIQLANRSGLLRRLEAVEKKRPLTENERLEFVRTELVGL